VIFSSLCFVLFLLISGIVWHGVSRYFLQRERAAARKQISQMLIKEVAEPSKSDVKLFEPYAGRVVLLKELESFSRRFKSEEWDKIRQQIAVNYLLPKARKHVHSLDWLKRNFAARSFALAPLKMDIALILKLVDDPVFLVRSRAALAAHKIQDRDLIYKLIVHMSDEPGYAHYYFRDLLLELESTKVLEWIEEFGLKETKRFTKIACLDLLSEKSHALTTPLLKEALASEDPLIRYYGIKVYARNPQTESRKILLEALKDPQEDIREEATRGLQYQEGDDVVEALKKGLDDPSWKVKVGAVRSLMKHGNKGARVLEGLDEVSDPDAYAAYIYGKQFE
jgi:HEAT repeat protein